MYFDSHTHLNAEEFLDNRDQHLDDFIAIGGRGLINIGANIPRSEKAIAIVQQTKKTYTSKDFFISASIGIHPSETCTRESDNTTIQPTITHETIDNNMQQLKELYRQHNDDICAIGECGIDLHYPGSIDVIQLQQELLARQCQFALDTGLPMVIHSRNGFPETIEVLNNFFGKDSNLPIVFHCFGYGPQEVQYLLEQFDNIYIGFDGNITYKSAQPLRDAFSLVPKEKVLVETDAPYLAPIPHRGEINTPKNIVYIYEFLAQLQETQLDDFATQILENSYRFFGISE